MEGWRSVEGGEKGGKGALAEGGVTEEQEGRVDVVRDFLRVEQVRRMSFEVVESRCGEVGKRGVDRTGEVILSGDLIGASGVLFYRAGLIADAI